MEEKINMNTHFDMLQKLTLGLHIITKRLGLCMPIMHVYIYIYIYIYINMHIMHV